MKHVGAKPDLRKREKKKFKKKKKTKKKHDGKS